METSTRVAGSSDLVVAAIPASHLALIDGPYWAALSTVLPDGQPQVTPVWCNRDGPYVLTNTMRGFRKERNMQANPRVTLLVYDPAVPLHNIEIRGRVVEMTESGASQHDDELARLYLGQPTAHFFGDAVPAHLAATHHPVKVTIAPIYVRTEAPATTVSAPRVPSDGPGEPPDSYRWADPGPVPDGEWLPVAIPNSHRDLLVSRVYGVLSTIMPDGQPQSSLVWVDYDGTHVLVNTALGRQKCRNMRANPRVTVLMVDPTNPARWIEVRGRVAAITPQGAIAHADQLTHRYTGKEHFYGDVYAVERRQQETRVLVKIAPIKVALDAIFR